MNSYYQQQVSRLGDRLSDARVYERPADARPDHLAEEVAVAARRNGGGWGVYCPSASGPVWRLGTYATREDAEHAARIAVGIDPDPTIHPGYDQDVLARCWDYPGSSTPPDGPGRLVIVTGTRWHRDEPNVTFGYVYLAIGRPAIREWLLAAGVVVTKMGGLSLDGCHVMCGGPLDSVSWGASAAEWLAS